MKNPALRLVGFLAVLFLVVGAAVALDSDDEPRSLGAPGGGRPTVELGDVRLVAAESCEELTAFFQDAATVAFAGMATSGGEDDEMVALEESSADMAGGAGGDTAGAASPAPSSPATTVAARDAAESEGGQGGGADGDEFSGTNLQERDVDEPDTVKTDGDIAVVASYGNVHVIDVGDDEPELLGTVELEQGMTELLLQDDRVLALTTTWREEPMPGAGGSEGDAARMVIGGKEVTILTAIDISDPSDPEIEAQVEHEGTYRTARATGTTARIVLVSYPQVVAYDEPTIRSMTAEDWTPEGVACDQVVHPTEPQGTSTTTVVTVDMQGDLDAIDTDAVVADAGTVYASSDRLYIATSQWQSGWQTPDGQPRTELHAFDITDPSSTEYVGSGAIDGFLLNQFSLSEHEGDLRVATTLQPPWEGDSQQASSSAVVVLAEQDDALAEIGRVDGLGVTEVIRSVRFMGDVAYVVTFRQTDPLYVIDLSDPRAPRTAGELKIPGFSSYLHPIDDGRMLGVGQDADEETGGTLGTLVQTFDVSDMTSPTAIDKVVIEHGSSQVEWDHRAFLWWAARRLAVIPVEVYPPFEGEPGVAVDCPPEAECLVAQPVPAPDAQQQGFVGAIAFGVDADGDVREAGRVTHAGRSQTGAWHSITRSFVVGDSLYTVSEAGLLKSSLDGYGDEGFVSLPMPGNVGGGVEPMPMPIEDGIGDGTSGSAGVDPAADPDVPPTTVPAEG